MVEYVYIRRLSDGKILDLPKAQLEMTLKRGGFEKVSDVPTSSTEEAPVVKAFNPTKCILCGFEAKNENGLRLHKQGKHQ